MSNRTCAVTDCGRPVFGHGWCNAHYKRWRKHGDPMSAIPVAAPPDADLANRFWAKVDKTDECWLWTGTLTSHGYGQFKVNNRRLRAHRVAYGLTIGPIPDGAILDHRCHVRSCVNPAHIRLVTVKQNSENRVGAQSNSASGVRGVSWCPRDRAWRAVVGHRGKYYSAGYFATLEDAAEAVRLKRIELFTHSDGR